MRESVAGVSNQGAFPGRNSVNMLHRLSWVQRHKNRLLPANRRGHSQAAARGRILRLRWAAREWVR